MNSQRTIFLTGATGQVGSYLLKIFLENNHKVFCLARSSQSETAEQRLVKALGFWDSKIIAQSKDNLKVIQGDITQNNLGLGQELLSCLEKEADCLVHSAALTKVNISLEDIRMVNVKGAKNVLDLSMQLKNKGKLKKACHISTAYVCGDYKGRFTEADLDLGQSFNTTYEQSKFEAEKLVGEYRKKGVWVDIFRPSVVVGESFSGKVNEFRNIYHLLQICSLEIFDSWPFIDSKISLVTVDASSKAIYKIIEEAEAKNRVYNIFPSNSSPVR